MLAQVPADVCCCCAATLPFLRAQKLLVSVLLAVRMTTHTPYIAGMNIFTHATTPPADVPVQVLGGPAEHDALRDLEPAHQVAQQPQGHALQGEVPDCGSCLRWPPCWARSRGKAAPLHCVLSAYFAAAVSAAPRPAATPWYHTRQAC